MDNFKRVNAICDLVWLPKTAIVVHDPPWFKQISVDIVLRIATQGEYNKENWDKEQKSHLSPVTKLLPLKINCLRH